MRHRLKELESEVAAIEKQNAQIDLLDDVSELVKELGAQVAGKLKGFSFHEKRLALDALQSKVVVGRSGVGYSV